MTKEKAARCGWGSGCWCRATFVVALLLLLLSLYTTVASVCCCDCCFIIHLCLLLLLLLHYTIVAVFAAATFAATGALLHCIRSRSPCFCCCHFCCCHLCFCSVTTSLLPIPSLCGARWQPGRAQDTGGGRPDAQDGSGHQLLDRRHRPGDGGQVLLRLRWPPGVRRFSPVLDRPGQGHRALRLAHHRNTGLAIQGFP